MDFAEVLFFLILFLGSREIGFVREGREFNGFYFGIFIYYVNERSEIRLS